MQNTIDPSGDRSASPAQKDVPQVVSTGESWQREELQKDTYARQLAYWRRQLAGAPPILDLPTHRPRPPLQSYQASMQTFALPCYLTDALLSLSRQEDVSLSIILVAAFQALLHRYSGQDDLLLGMVTASQIRSEGHDVIGDYLNTVALRTDMSGDPPFSEFLKRVRYVILSARHYEDMPFDVLMKDLYPELNPSYQPLIQVLLAFQDQSPTFPAGWTLTQSVISRFDLCLELVDRPEGLTGRFTYNTDLFDASTISRMIGHWQTLLAGIIVNPARHLAALPLLTEEEEHLLLVDWNDTATSYPRDQCLHQLFEAQVERTPDAIAASFANEYLTYRQLNSAANQLAHHLRELGVRGEVGKEVLVGICLERSLEMIIGLLGILKAGGAYVPLDPTYPTERLTFMLEDARVAVLVTHSSLLAQLPYHGGAVVCMDTAEATLAQHSTLNPTTAVDPANLAYVIYTSGSTGRPKGVQVLHHAVVNFMLSMQDQPGISSADTLLAVTTLSFDIAALELFLPLLVGARLIIASRDVVTSGAALAQTLARTGTTVMQATPVTWRVLLAEGWQGSEKLKILCGGEALPLELARQLLARGASLFNMYGPTETTIWSSVQEIRPDHASIAVGRPIANTQIYLLDTQLQLVPVGVAGELFIGGDGLARDYLGRPELTAERFISHPFSTDPGARLYRTGDLARYRPDGTIEVIGRSDSQIKLRGFRIELGEIEAVLRQHATVHEAVVVVREDTPGDKRLTAYVIARKGQALSGAELQRYIMKHVPDYMVPAAVVLLEAFPLTPNGKIDRRSLPPADYGQSAQSQEQAGPRTPLEAEVAQAWSQVLDIHPIDIHDNFFVLGGHSLLAMQVIARLRSTLQVELPLRSFFEAPTIAQLSELIGRQALPALLTPIEAVSREPYLLAVDHNEKGQVETIVMPTSSAQQGLWLLEQLEPNSPIYNLPITLRLLSRLDGAILARSLQALVGRHETLRTTFTLLDGQPMQVIEPRMQVPFAMVDLRALSPEQREKEVQRLASREVRQPFDLAHGPLLRAMGLQLGEEEHLLVLVMHHIISDGWSVGVLAKELAQLYSAFASDQRVELPTLPMQYADYALWQRERMRGRRLNEQLAYWKERLAGAPPLLALPTDHPRPAIPSQKGGFSIFTLSQALSEGLKHLSRREGVTLYMTLLAAFEILLQRYTGQNDIVIGTTTAGRDLQETRDLVGYFINTLVLRTDLSTNPSVRELLSRVREVVLGAHTHQEVPFERLVKELQPERSLSQQPIFQVLLTFDPPLPELVSPWEFTQMALGTGASKFDLSLSLADRAEGVSGYVEYNADLFEEASIARLMMHWRTLLEGIVADPQQRVADLPLLTRHERHQQLVEWQAPPLSSDDRTIPQLFAAQVERTPEAVAVVCEQQQLTYRELNARANQLARHLRQLGVRSEAEPEVLIGLCVERSLELIVGLLAILKAGAGYVPLDPDYPSERLAYVLAETQMPLLLSQQMLLARLPQHAVKVVCLDSDWPTISQQSPANPSIAPGGERLAYVIYTSGSTGQPKGVLIPHAAIAAHCQAIARIYQLGPQDRVLQFSMSAFDASLEQILPTLLVGARLQLRGREIWSPLQLLEQVRQRELSVMNLPPAYWQQVVRAWAQVPERLAAHRLRLLIVGGDRLPPEALQEWRQLPWLAQVRLLNAYGPTETTITALLCDLTDQPPAPLRVPIGRPLPGRTAYILDRAGQLVPPGVAGELHIGGALLARGYLKHPVLTAERFIADPFSRQVGARLYKTGDLARYLPDGMLEFVGRLDQQVKIRGFRIELGEIEAVLRQHPAVRQAVVVTWEDTAGEPFMLGYVVADKDRQLESQALRSYLKQRLPEYMLPAAFVQLENLPLLATGKPDRQALPAPELGRLTREEAFVAPRLPIHRQLVQIWQELLDAYPIGIKDNFFFLGGHSLLAVRLVDRIEQAFGKRIALSTLFSGPTIEQLAAALQQQDDADARAVLLPVQTGGSKRPFFFLHGDWTGGAFYCFTLARALGPEQPFYALEPYKLAGLQTIPSLESMAAAHIESLRAIQPAGPYLLGGFCNGGLLAYEMARQLQAAGEQVDFLALINPSQPVQFKSIRAVGAVMNRFLHFGTHRQANLFLRARHALRHVYRRLRPSGIRVQDFEQLLVIDPRLEAMFPPLDALYNDYVGVFTWMVLRYETGIYAGKITFYWAREEPFSASTWSPVTDMKASADIVSYTVAGTHMSCVTEHIQDLATVLSRSVSGAAAEAAGSSLKHESLAFPQDAQRA